MPSWTTRRRRYSETLSLPRCFSIAALVDLVPRKEMLSDLATGPSGVLGMGSLCSTE